MDLTLARQWHGAARPVPREPPRWPLPDVCSLPGVSASAASASEFGGVRARGGDVDKGSGKAEQLRDHARG